MSRLFYHTMQDNLGNLLFGVTGTMRLAGTGTAATIYGDEALTVPIPNPMTNHPSFGSFKCFLGVGDFDFYMAKAGYTFETLTGVQGAGTMGQQDSSYVTITGGDIIGLVQLNTSRLGVGGNAPATAGQSYFAGSIGINHPAQSNIALRLGVSKSTQTGLEVHCIENDAAISPSIWFTNVAGTGVGSIVTTASATAYNTSSDGRLKTDVMPLAGALDTILALRPVQFRWKVDGSLGHGLIAQEVAQIVPGVVSSTETLGIDYSKLVPWLVSAVKELTQQVEMLQAQLAAVGP